MIVAKILEMHIYTLINIYIDQFFDSLSLIVIINFCTIISASRMSDNLILMFTIV